MKGKVRKQDRLFWTPSDYKVILKGSDESSIYVHRQCVRARVLTDIVLRNRTCSIYHHRHRRCNHHHHHILSQVSFPLVLLLLNQWCTPTNQASSFTL